MVSRSLTLASLRFYRRHPWQFGLTLLSIALGSAVMIAVDLANNSARESFARSVDQVSPAVTHRILSVAGLLDERDYFRLRRNGLLTHAMPIVEGHFDHGGERFIVLGSDPLAALSGGGQLPESLWPADVAGFLLGQPGAVVLSATAAERLGVTATEGYLTISTDRGDHELPALVLAQSNESLLPDNTVLADIATVQDVFEKVGYLDRIDLISDEKAVESLTRQLPDGLKLEAVDFQQQALDQMTQAFRTNLTAMSLLAMLVSAFLVYNTMTFSVLQRRQQFAIERMVGVTGTGLAQHVLLEALLLGLCGALAGCLLGVLLGQGLLVLVTRTISDLYAVVDMSVLALQPVLLAKGLGLTLLVVLIATAGPMLEAARTPPVSVHRSSVAEDRIGRLSRWLPWLSVLLLLAGLTVIAASGRSLVAGFSGLFILVIAWSLLVPLLTGFALGLVRRYSPAQTVIWRMAVRGLQASQSRTLLAIMALSIAVSASIGVGVMISSFRLSVAHWLETTLQSDIYIASAGENGNPGREALNPRWPDEIRAIDGVAAVSTGHRKTVYLDGRPIPLLVLEPGPHSSRGFRFTGGSGAEVWRAFEQGRGVLASEPLAWHHEIAIGDRLAIFSDESVEAELQVAGIHQDYSASQGMLVISRKLHDRIWPDRSFSSIGIALEPGAKTEFVREKLGSLVSGAGDAVLIRSNADIRDRSLAIFDRTFAITSVLRVLVILVAVVGVFSALMAMSLEKTREYSVLRASGMTVRQVFRLVLFQTGLTGLIAGLLAIPPGWFMADILIDVVNRRSFGWTMDKIFPPELIVQAVLVSVLAALLAGLYPARRMARYSVSRGLRET